MNEITWIIITMNLLSLLFILYFLSGFFFSLVFWAYYKLTKQKKELKEIITLGFDWPLICFEKLTQHI